MISGSTSRAPASISVLKTDSQLWVKIRPCLQVAHCTEDAHINTQHPVKNSTHAQGTESVHSTKTRTSGKACQRNGPGFWRRTMNLPSIEGKSSIPEEPAAQDTKTRNDIQGTLQAISDHRMCRQEKEQERRLNTWAWAISQRATGQEDLDFTKQPRNIRRVLN